MTVLVEPDRPLVGLRQMGEIANSIYLTGSDPQEPSDHTDGERSGEVGDDVAGALTGYRIDQFICPLGYVLGHDADRAPSEHSRHQLTEARVIRRVGVHQVRTRRRMTGKCFGVHESSRDVLAAAEHPARLAAEEGL